MATSHAEGIGRQRHPRPNQRIPVEDSQERTGCSWVSLFEYHDRIALRIGVYTDTATVFFVKQTHVSLLFKNSASLDLN